MVFLPFALLLAFILYRSGRWEREVIRTELATEASDFVTASEQAQIARDGAFRTRRIDATKPHGSSALVRLQNELAFRKRYLRTRGDDPAADPLVARRRREISQLRAVAGL